MKVLDLQCSKLHLFECWFASEEDFRSQCLRGLVQCPVCADPTVEKKLSAPRLNLSGARETQAPKQEQAGSAAIPSATPLPIGEVETALAAAWMAVARHVVANTTDVGSKFAEEARKMHYGEAEVRSIRGQTTPEQALELVEEGIEVMPLLLPEALKGPLQ
ncbi:DUF1178 family protein [Rhodoferax sp.]|uniref:DUF1178 family protein n=1 Tax=Rhodoferax sp. TaxID=50421 RepID=UPI002ACEC4BE|nr:DUF1178 family protein [Rhodoferax sp.]MDZ7921302.1 DUF1178 family protein [Rhodoferax sp.]